MMRKIPNIIGSYFEEINSQEKNVPSTLENIVEKKINVIKSDLSELRPPVIFDIANRGTKSKDIDSQICFTNIRELKSILKHMRNKPSTGIDEIPNVVLKKITYKVIKSYVILFNNALNNKYFPQSWKTAKLYIVLLKKKKGVTTMDNL